MRDQRNNPRTGSGLTHDHPTTGDQPTGGCYEIRFRGELDDRWTAWFDGLTVHTHGDGTTVLEGEFSDQAAIHGVLARVRDLGLALVSVTPTNTSQTDEEEEKS